MHCQESGAAHYYLAIEVKAMSGGEHRVRVRALDLEEQTWVSGFGQQWQGHLSRAQRVALGERQTDEYLRGLRVLPFDPSQTDLAAEYLAHNLGCLMQSRGFDQLSVRLQSHDSDSETSRRVAELLADYLAGIEGIEGIDIVEPDDPADAVLRIREHPISVTLTQLWARITPASQPAEISDIGTQVYLTATGVANAAIASTPTATAAQPAVAKGDRPDGLLSSIQVIKPADTRSCRGSNPWRNGIQAATAPEVRRGECFALQIELHEQVRVFLLNHGIEGELLRMLPNGCGKTARAPRLDAGDKLRITAGGNRRSSAFDWQGQAGTETFYVFAANGEVATRRLARHLNQLPTPCSRNVRRNGKLHTLWLKELDRLVKQLGECVDWQAVRVRHIS